MKKLVRVLIEKSDGGTQWSKGIIDSDDIIRMVEHEGYSQITFYDLEVWNIKESITDIFTIQLDLKHPN